VFAINDAGQVASGYWSVQDSHSHLVLNTNGKLSNLGPPIAGIFAGISLNNAGQVAGGLADNATTHAFLYSGGTFRDLGFSSSTTSFAVAINGSGQVAGWVVPNINVLAKPAQPFVYSGGKIQTLPFNGFATGLNDAGQVVGYKVGASGWHAFLDSGGKLTDLGSLPGEHSSAATAINNAGQVVGWSYVNPAAPHQPIPTHAFLYSGGKMTDLGTLGGLDSYARAINDAGQVVGTSGLSKGGQHAFLFTNGKMVDLNSLISPESRWQLINAWAINNRGQILGVASNGQGVTSQVLLTPVAAPEPGSLTLLGIGAVSLAGCAWRKRKRLTHCAPCTAAAPAPGRAP